MSAHRAHGLDTHICIFLRIYFSEIQLLLHDFATFWYSLLPCIVMCMFLCSGVVKCILTRRGGSKSFKMNDSRRTCPP